VRIAGGDADAAGARAEDSLIHAGGVRAAAVDDVALILDVVLLTALDHLIHKVLVHNGGWVTELLERFPDVGDTFTWQNINLTVEALDEMRVTQIKIEVLPLAEPEENDD